MDRLWKNAKKLDDKYYKVWLVWTIGKYANGCPWIELRAIYTDKGRADRIADSIKKYEIPQYNQGLSAQYHGESRMRLERVYVEKRVTNHKYGGEMMELAWL